MVDSKIRVGWGQADITPKGQAISLIGQWEERITKEVRDPIYAIAMVIQSAGGRTVWVACDLVHITKSLSDAVKERLRASLPGFEDDQLVLSATHIHTGPNTDSDPFTTLLDGRRDPENTVPTVECCRQIADGIERAVLAAAKNPEASHFELAYSYTITGVNRRATYKDGTAVMYGDVHRPDFAGMEGRDGGPMQIVYVRRYGDNKLTGVIAAVPCTAQCDEMADYVTADYWCTAREVIRAGLSEDVFVLGLIRSAGDLSPHLMVDRAKHLNRQYGGDGAQIMGKRVGEAVLRAEQDIIYTASSDAPHENLCVDEPMPIWSATDEQYKWGKQYLAENKGALGPLSDMMAFSSAAAYVKRYEASRAEYPANLHAVRIGDIVLLTNPFELFIKYADRIRMACPEAVVIDVQLAGDESLGYLATTEAIAGGGYSSMIFSGLTNDVGGNAFVEASIQMVKQIMGETGK